MARRKSDNCDRVKTELKVVPHLELPDAQVIEVRYDGRLIAVVYGNDGPGVRIVSKYAVENHVDHVLKPPLSIAHVTICLPSRN